MIYMRKIFFITFMTIAGFSYTEAMDPAPTEAENAHVRRGQLLSDMNMDTLLPILQNHLQHLKFAFYFQYQCLVGSLGRPDIMICHATHVMDAAYKNHDAIFAPRIIVQTIQNGVIHFTIEHVEYTYDLSTRKFLHGNVEISHADNEEERYIKGLARKFIKFFMDTIVPQYLNA